VIGKIFFPIFKALRTGQLDMADCRKLGPSGNKLAMNTGAEQLAILIIKNVRAIFEKVKHGLAVHMNLHKRDPLPWSSSMVIYYYFFGKNAIP
jgi:hypothetical protein